MVLILFPFEMFPLIFISVEWLAAVIAVILIVVIPIAVILIIVTVVFIIVLGFVHIKYIAWSVIYCRYTRQFGDSFLRVMKCIPYP